VKTISIVIKEMKIFFNNPMSYIISIIFLLITGWFFSSSLFIVKLAEISSLLNILPFILLFFIPAIAMKTIAEEQRQGTIELMLTNPVSDLSFILGKYYSTILIMCFLYFFTLIYPIVLAIAGDPDGGKIIVSYIGLLLLTSLYISIGIFASAFTRNQIVAFIVAFMIIFIFFMLDKVTIFFPAHLQVLLQYLSITYHFNNFTLGFINMGDVTYYITFTILFLYLAYYKITERYY
jgi:ABC-2 type transport system permease protein